MEFFVPKIERKKKKKKEKEKKKKKKKKKKVCIWQREFHST